MAAHALIRVFHGTGDPTVIPVMFNPTTYSITRGMKYADVAMPGLPMPLLQFVGGEAQEIKDLVLFLDGSDRVQVPQVVESGTPEPFSTSWRVEDRLRALRTLVTIDSHLHAPPVVRFEFGNTQFTAVVTTYKEDFLMFAERGDEAGSVIRAKVTLSLKSYTTAERLYRRVNQQSPDRTKTRVVRQGERLDRIAAEEYGDPSLWPVLARANGLARPRIVPAGTLLTIPPLD